MRVAIAGLGLIGGSFAKAVKAKTPHHVTGYDADGAVSCGALHEGAIDAVDADGVFGDCDMALVALYPADSVSFIKRAAGAMKRGAVIVDLCGVKRYVCGELAANMGEGVTFIGGHPMAGREASGYEASSADLFEGASMILTPLPGTRGDKLREAEAFFLSLGFGKITLTTPERHDEMIAFTSQLAHVVSSAYAQCPLSESFDGFSAGSFGDMTRVAKLNEHMWTELFLRNADCLSEQIGALIANLENFRRCVSLRDGDALAELLRCGRIVKERLEEKERAR
jgi:prephenate dehydrogenase